MANPASLTIRDLTANSSLIEPAAQSIDTDGSVYTGTAPGKFDRLFIYVVNTASAAVTVGILAGDQPPANRSGAGAYSVSMAATGSSGAKRMFGPFESARFAQDDGTIGMSFLAASSTPTVSVTVYRLPAV